MGALAGAFLGKLVFILGLLFILITGLNLPLIIFDWSIKFTNLFSGTGFIKQLMFNGIDAGILKSPFFIIYLTIVIITFGIAIFLTIKSSLGGAISHNYDQKRGFKSGAEKYKWFFFWFIGVIGFPLIVIALSYLVNLLCGLLNGNSDPLLMQLTTDERNTFFKGTTNFANSIYSLYNSSIIGTLDDPSSYLSQIYNGTISADDLKNVIKSYESQSIWYKIFSNYSDGSISLDNLKHFIDKYNNIMGTSNFSFATANDITQFRNNLSKLIDQSGNLEGIKNITNNLLIQDINIDNYKIGRIGYVDGIWKIVSPNSPSAISVTWNDILNDDLLKSSNGAKNILVPETITTSIQNVLFPLFSGQSIYGDILTYGDGTTGDVQFDNSLGGGFGLLTIIKLIGGIFNLIGTLFTEPFNIILTIIGILGVMGLIASFMQIAIMVLQRNFELVYLTAMMPFGIVKGLDDNGQKFEVIFKTMMGKILSVFVITLCLSIFQSLLEISFSISRELVSSTYSDTGGIIFLVFKTVADVLVINSMAIVLIQTINFIQNVLNSNSQIDAKFSYKGISNKIIGGVESTQQRMQNAAQTAAQNRANQTVK